MSCGKGRVTNSCIFLSLEFGDLLLLSGICSSELYCFVSVRKVFRVEFRYVSTKKKKANNKKTLTRAALDWTSGRAAKRLREAERAANMFLEVSLEERRRGL